MGSWGYNSINGYIGVHVAGGEITCTWDEKETWKISPPCKEGVVRGLYRGCALNYAWDTQKKPPVRRFVVVGLQAQRGSFLAKSPESFRTYPSSPAFEYFKVGFFRFNSPKIWIFSRGPKFCLVSKPESFWDQFSGSWICFPGD